MVFQGFHPQTHGEFKLAVKDPFSVLPQDAGGKPVVTAMSPHREAEKPSVESLIFEGHAAPGWGRDSGIKVRAHANAFLTSILS